MKIYVDGDACPVKDIVIRLCKKHGVDTVLIYSTSHFGNSLDPGYTGKDGVSGVEKIMVDNESQAVDMAIINRVKNGDIVVTGDYGLASLVLPKKACAISFSGTVYNEENIDRLLMERHVGQVIRRSGGRVKGPSKRKKEDNEKFEGSLNSLILKIMKDI